jgi:cytochrome c oxidase cbb3-type subunit 1
MRPFYAIRALGGLLYVAGSLIMAYNLWRTIRGDVASEKLSAAMPFAARA